MGVAQSDRGPPAEAVAPSEGATPPCPALSTSRLSWWSVAAWGVILIGGVLRIRTYVAGRSLRRDEAHLTLNLVRRSFAGLFEPLDYAQGAPVGFLMLEKGAISALGVNEWALRLVPLAAGLAALPLFWLVARRLLGPRAALVGLILMAFTEPMVYYASEVKQYSCDVLVGLAILAVATWAPSSSSNFDSTPRNGRGWSIDRPIWLAVVGAVAVWFSHPALFVLGGVGTALILPELGSGVSRRRRVVLLGVVACWGASFLVDDLLFLHKLRMNEDLLGFWAGSFMPLPPRSGADLKWYATTLFGVLENPVGLAPAMAGTAVALLALGGLSLARRDPRVLGLLATPILLTLAASGLRAYPFSGRLLLFAVPLLALMIAAGAEFVWGCRDLERRTIALVLLALVLFDPALNVVRFLARPLQGEELKTVLLAVEQRRRPGDELYLYFASEPVFHFYSREADRRILADLEPIMGTDSLSGPGSLAADVQRLAGRPRVWFVVSHAIQGDEGTLRRLLDGSGRCLDRIDAFGASAALYDLSEAPRPAAVRPASD